MNQPLTYPGTDIDEWTPSRKSVLAKLYSNGLWVNVNVATEPCTDHLSQNDEAMKSTPTLHTRETIPDSRVTTKCDICICGPPPIGLLGANEAAQRG